MKLLGKIKNRVLIALVCALALALGLAFGLPARRTASAETVSPDTLETTINSAPADGTYQLNGDVNKAITLTPSHNIVLDLGTHTITGKVTVNGTGTLTIKNGKITGPSTDYVIENAGTLILGEKGVEDLTVFNTGSSTDDGASSIVNLANGHLTIESGTYSHCVEVVPGTTKSNSVVKNNSNGTLTINGGNYTGQILSYGTAEINGGTYKNSIYGGQKEQPTGTLTIKGGTIEGFVETYVKTVISGNPTVEQQAWFYSSDVTISGGTFGTSAAEYAILVYGSESEGDKFVIQGGTFTGRVKTVSELTIEDGTFNGMVFTDKGETGSVGDLTIKGGTFSAQIQSKANLTIEGGEFTKSDGAAVIAWRKDGATGTVSVTGGTFSGKIIAYNGSEAVIEGAVTVDSSDNVKFKSSDILPDKSYFGSEANKQTVTNADGTVSFVDDEDIVAEVDTGAGQPTQYSKVGAAIANAAAGKIVKLIKASTEDIVVPAKVNNVTLDLDGKTITGTESAVVLTVQKGATLTIKSSAANGKITGSSAHYVIDNSVKRAVSTQISPSRTPKKTSLRRLRPLCAITAPSRLRVVPTRPARLHRMPRTRTKMVLKRGTSALSRTRAKRKCSTSTAVLSRA